MIVEYKILLGICIWLILGLISVIVYIVDCYKNTIKDEDEYSIVVLDLILYGIIIVLGPLLSIWYFIFSLNWSKKFFTFKKNKK